MYTPRHFADSDIDSCIDLMRANSFATLIGHREGSIEATHLPMLIETADDAALTVNSISIAFHLARQNPLCSDLDAGNPILIVFTGHHGYISPHWYANKTLVPTWNYTAVHASGRPELMTDEQLAQMLHAVSINNESRLSHTAWTPDDMDQQAYTQMRKSIRGYRVKVTALTGKAKLNQNRTVDDRRGAINGLRAIGRPDSDALADLMQQHLGKDD